MGGTYAYIHLNPHPTAGKWNANPPHTTGSNLAYGIIERQAVAQVTITSFTPSSGKIGDGVAIYVYKPHWSFQRGVQTHRPLIIRGFKRHPYRCPCAGGATTGQIFVTANAKSATSADVLLYMSPLSWK